VCNKILWITAIIMVILLTTMTMTGTTMTLMSVYVLIFFG